MAMWDFPDHPDIAACERTGYPTWFRGYDDSIDDDDEIESDDDEIENY